MPEPVMFIRGFPQSLFDSNPAANKPLVEDMKTIADLSDEQVAAICQRLEEATGFLDPKTLLSTILQAVQDAKVAEAVRGALRNLTPPGVERMVVGLAMGLEDKGFPFDQKTLDRLKHVLGKLIQPYPALTGFQKAKHLSTLTGQQLETVELVCDLRPVFDDKREKLDGMMPYTRLHLVATGEDGLPKPFEAELTYQQVIDLAEKARKAESKLKVLRQSIESWLPGGLPELPLTRAPRKESNDG